MKLNFEKYCENAAKNSLIIIHGLYGSAANFKGLAKIYSKYFDVYCIDLRNHGDSPHANNMSYKDMADDVLKFMDDQGLSSSHILGHSMGGKVAMQLALNYPERIEKLIIGDISPVHYPHHHEKIFEGLVKIPLKNINSRGAADNILSHYVNEAGIRMFLLTNLRRGDDGNFKWRINLKVLIREYKSISAAPKGTSHHGQTLFIRGELSEYIANHHVPIIMNLFPNARIETIDGCSHWLHSEKPKEFSKILLNFLA